MQYMCQKIITKVHHLKWYFGQKEKKKVMGEISGGNLGRKVIVMEWQLSVGHYTVPFRVFYCVLFHVILIRTLLWVGLSPFSK